MDEVLRRHRELVQVVWRLEEAWPAMRAELNGLHRFVVSALRTERGPEWKGPPPAEPPY